MGYSSMMYIIVNINEQCARFPQFTGLTIGLICSLYDASAGMFLIFKLIYQAKLATLPLMLTIFTIGTSTIWIKTIFFTPYRSVTPGLSAFQSSAMNKALLCNKNDDQVLDHVQFYNVTK